ncbi:MAG: sigma-54-dependent Fis family transcriptional regulator [Deltaproteobacteria bacterium]|nr:sigma-54-dependent Fis family transcriptional regulator [Deltaproteobacteria bacterium]
MGDRVLIADDLAPNRRVLESLLKASGFEVELAEDGPSAVKMATAQPPPSLVMLDLRMPGGGLEALAEIRAAQPHLPAIVLTSYADVPAAVEAMKLGAVDFLTRPLPNDALLMAVKRALERSALEKEVKTLRRALEAPDAVRGLLSASPSLREVADRVSQVARTPLTVLVVGETGVGKEVVARAIHMESGRSGPFVAIDCGAIPENLIESELFGHERGAFSGAERKREGRFALAAGGTVFLDEIGNLPKQLQPKLLRALQERRVTPLGGTHDLALDVRFVAATNAALEQDVSDGNFREDLYYRLSEFTIRIPPLRERAGDLLPLSRRFMEEANLDMRRSVAGISTAAAERLRTHHWPGNVRELRNVVREAVLGAQGPTLEESDIDRAMSARAPMRGLSAQHAAMSMPPPAQPSSGPIPIAATPAEGIPTGDAEGGLRQIANRATEIAERKAIAEALREAGGNKSKAARALQVDFKTLHAKIKRYGLEPE